MQPSAVRWAACVRRDCSCSAAAQGGSPTICTRSCVPPLTVAVDINPLLMAVARRMYAAERVDLYEFPVAPRDLASHALLRALTAPARAEPGLHLVFGDAKQPPFAPGSFDTVVTPWLVDVVDTDLESLAATVNSLLAPGGRWVCTGTLFFQQADPAQAYSSEEVQEIVAGAGFESPAAADVAPAVPGVAGEPARAGRGGRHVRSPQAARGGAAAAPVAAVARGPTTSGAAVARGGRPRARPPGARLRGFAGRRPALA